MNDLFKVLPPDEFKKLDEKTKEKLLKKHQEFYLEQVKKYERSKYLIILPLLMLLPVIYIFFIISIWEFLILFLFMVGVLWGFYKALQSFYIGEFTTGYYGGSSLGAGIGQFRPANFEGWPKKDYKGGPARFYAVIEILVILALYYILVIETIITKSLVVL